MTQSFSKGNTSRLSAGSVPAMVKFIADDYRDLVFEVCPSLALTKIRPQNHTITFRSAQGILEFSL